METIACVLRSGPEFRVEHVLALANGVQRNLSRPHRFVCLTDLVNEVKSAGIEAIKLPQAWPGWFAKIELFAPGVLKGPTLYFDLDVVIVGPLDDIVAGHHFTMCQDFYQASAVNSSVMAWDCDLSGIYSAFARDPHQSMADYCTHDKWGDQAFIANYAPVEPERWQIKHPGAVVSYKVNVRKKHAHPRETGDGSVPKGARVVCFHGRPRPWETGLWQI